MPEKLHELLGRAAKSAPGYFPALAATWMATLSAAPQRRTTLRYMIGEMPECLATTWAQRGNTMASGRACDCWAAAVARSIALILHDAPPAWSLSANRLSTDAHRSDCVNRDEPLPWTRTSPPPQIRYRKLANESPRDARRRLMLARIQRIFRDHGFYGPTELPALALFGRGRPPLSPEKRRERQRIKMARYRQRRAIRQGRVPSGSSTIQASSSVGAD